MSWWYYSAYNAQNVMLLAQVVPVLLLQFDKFNYIRLFVTKTDRIQYFKKSKQTDRQTDRHYN